MRRIYEFLLILIIGAFVYITIDNATDRIMNRESSDNVNEKITLD